MSKTTNYKRNTNSSATTVAAQPELKKDAKYFQHNGYYGANPNKVKKGGRGKGNWGGLGDEINDLEDHDDDIPNHMYNKNNRRNSNHQLEEEKFSKIQKYHV